MPDEMQTPNTSNSDSNETTVHGNVTTSRDFVGRDLTVHGDQVQGDKVVGDKISAGDRGVAAGQIIGSTLITGDNNTINYPRLDLTDARNQRNHATMRQLVRKFWIDGVLKSSLYNEVLIRLNLTEQPKAVDNRPWDLILQKPGQPNYALPAGTPIIDVYDQMNQRLLILGEPGSGKTIMLLELADALLKRAEADPTHPTPVVFNLSSWAEKRQPLAEWLVDELRTKYNIPKKTAQKWVEDDELLLLLDGLDEAQEKYRNECVVAINIFRQDHLVPVVVCSRVNEYENLTVQLKLQAVVSVQPLTPAQIDEYLDKVGIELSTIRVTLQQDIELQRMTITPLLLNIILIAYHDLPVEVIALNSSIQPRFQHLFDAYIKRMFLHRKYTPSYPIQQTVHWLSWLAGNMNQRQQTIFLIENLQPDCLKNPTHLRLYHFIVILICGLGIGILDGTGGGLTNLLVYGIVGGPLYKPIYELFDGLVSVSIARFTTGLILGLMIGMMSGLLMGWLIMIQEEIKPLTNLKFNWNRGLAYGIKVWPVGALCLGLLIEFFPGYKRLSNLVFNNLPFGLPSTLASAILAGLVVGVFFGLLVGWDYEQIEVAQTTKPNQGVWDSVQNMLVFGLISGLLCGLISGLLFGRIGDPIYGVVFGLLGGLVGGQLIGFVSGAECAVKHTALRLTLWWNNYSPFAYSQFLNYCHARLFLRKVGGGYIFIHRTLLEHFASLTDDDIKRLAAEVEASRS